MGKFPIDRPSSSSARYNPMARPATPKADSPAASGPAPASPGAPAGAPNGQDPASPHERPPRGLQSDGQAMEPAPAGMRTELDDELDAFIAEAFRDERQRGQANPPANPHPASLPAAPSHASAPDAGYTQAMLNGMQWEGRTGQTLSAHNGFKLMPPHIREAIRQAEPKLPANAEGFPLVDAREHGLLFKEDPRTGRLTLADHRIGEENSVTVPPEIASPSAKVHLHTHPFTGFAAHDVPSMGDQIQARLHPHVDFILQKPARLGETNEYLSFTGAYPPRYYALVENPGGLPAPRSPDGNLMPPNRPHPAPPDSPAPPFSPGLLESLLDPTDFPGSPSHPGPPATPDSSGKPQA